MISGSCLDDAIIILSRKKLFWLFRAGSGETGWGDVNREIACNFGEERRGLEALCPFGEDGEDLRRFVPSERNREDWRCRVLLERNEEVSEVSGV